MRLIRETPIYTLLKIEAAGDKAVEGKDFRAYPEHYNSDPGAERNDVIQGDVLVLPLNDTGPDQMPPVCPDGARTAKVN